MMNTVDELYAQTPYQWRLEWGPTGARRAAARGDVVVVVDTLSFSSSVATAASRGAVIVPCMPGEDADGLAAKIGGLAAVRRPTPPAAGICSLSPMSFLEAARSSRIVITSVNGAVCSRIAEPSGALFAGTLLNAAATRSAAWAEAGDRCGITIVACGEIWVTDSGIDGLRFAIEDYLGAGAILTRATGSMSPEASVCAAAFEGVRSRLEETLWDCGSARELRSMGYEDDVRHVSRLDLYDVAAVLRYGGFQPWSGPERQP